MLPIRRWLPATAMKAALLPIEQKLPTVSTSSRWSRHQVAGIIREYHNDVADSSCSATRMFGFTDLFREQLAGLEIIARQKSIQTSVRNRQEFGAAAAGWQEASLA